MFAGHWVCQGAAVFLCLGACLFVSAVSTHSWLFVTGICGIAVLLYASLAYAKFEIWDGGFSHRSLSGNHVFEFVQIENALFETENVDDGYAPVFSLRLKGEVRRNKIPIGMFGLHADALLFTALERYGIPIRQDGSGMVERSIQRIREAQSADGNTNIVDSNTKVL